MNSSFFPCIWCHDQATEMAAFYCAIFPHSEILSDNNLVVQVTLNGSRLMFLNGGPHFTPNEAVSLVIECDSQEEIDHYWYALSKGGSESRCGWLKDPFGLSWQIVPRELGSLLSNPATHAAVMEALLQMNKLDLPTLQQAAGRL